MSMLRPARTYTPSVKQESVVNLETLHGGLNTYELPYRIGKEESPEMKNLIWRDGALRSRDAQAWLTYKKLGYGYAVFDGEYYGSEFYHIGSKIYRLTGAIEPITVTFTVDTTISDIGFTRVKTIEGGTYEGDHVTVTGDSCTVTYLRTDLTEVCDILTLTGISESELDRGTFFRYKDDLFYKARGIFIRIKYDTLNGFTAENVVENAYVPTIFINCDPRNGSGDQYQYENRLSPEKKVTYNATLEDKSGMFVNGNNNRFADGRTTTKAIPFATGVQRPYSIDYIRIIAGNGTFEFSNNIGYYYEPFSGTIYLDEEVECQKILGSYEDLIPETTVNGGYERVNYYVPVADADTEIVLIKAIMSNTSVFTDLTESTAVLTADPTVWNQSWDGDFVFWAPTGHILFKVAPHYFYPYINNTVEVIYSLDNPDAQSAILSCNIVKVYGGETSMCIVMAGCTGQENAFFWNGNNIAMDASYFPMISYNFVGDNYEPITGFGIQQGMLVIFKQHSVWKSTLGTQTINDYVLISFDVTGVNAKKGCDLPYTIQLIDNNLVFCNTEDGINMLADTSSANENNLISISTKINGTPKTHGILWKASNAEFVTSYDDNERYTLVIDDECYVWDYTLSTYRSPSFFYMTDISAVGFTKNGLLTHHLNKDGQISVIGELSLDDNFSMFGYSDYGKAIEKRYKTPTFYFGTYDSLKDVVRMIVQCSLTTLTETSVIYETDNERRRDLTNLFGRVKGRNLHFRNLTVRDLGTDLYSITYLRKPGCRHVHWFNVTFEAAEPGCDMSLSAIQIFYKYMGRIR